MIIGIVRIYLFLDIYNFQFCVPSNFTDSLVSILILSVRIYLIILIRAFVRLMKWAAV